MSKRVRAIAVAILMLLSFIGIIVDIAPMVEGPAILEVDDSGGKPYTNIQDAVDDAQPGDTVFVYSGFYDEDVIVEKTINLTGEDRDSTIINGSAGGGSVWARYADYINVSGFTFQNGGTGISIYYSNFSRVVNCEAISNQYGIIVSNSNSTVIKGNIASNNSDYHGIYLDESTNITVKNNICFNNNANGIFVYDSSWNNIIIANNCSNNSFGISVDTFSEINLIIRNNVTFNSNYGLGVFSNNNTFEENIIISNNIGVRTNGLVGDTNKLINSTIKSSVTNDIFRGFVDSLILLNTTFNKSSVSYQGTSSISYVQWYLHVNVMDYLGNPIPNANVKIEDNKNGTYNETLITDNNGKIRWLPITEYMEKDTSGDNIGEKTFFTPHRIIAWNDTLVGYAQPLMNESKTVTIVLYNGTLLDLEPGWNLVSLPRIQSNTNLQIVFQSIENRYDATQLYNVTDNNDHWKHYHIAKPPNLNDLKKINHTIGFWLHITDPQGTTLVVFGNELIANQSITIYSGWNLLGYPSLIGRIRDTALNNINFSTDVDSIWTFNATTQNWDEIEASDSFVIGKGYWIHSKSEKVWDVPL